MKVTTIEVPGHEFVYRLEGRPAGFLALHRTRGGKAFGGVRIRTYPRPEAALDDALLLSRAMTLKLAAVGIPGGGGKAVLDERSLGEDRVAALARFGEWVESLGGRYVTGPDMGCSAEDMAVLRAHTGSIVHGDLSAPTALGVRQAMRGALAAARGAPRLAGCRVAVQGLGAVGEKLVRLLADDGAEILVADIDAERVARTVDGTGVEAQSPDEILRAEVDVLAPCAIGGVVTAPAVDTLRAAIVCGGANNILDDDATADQLHARRILLVPDFLSNAGGAVVGASTHLEGPGDYTPRVLALEQRVHELLSDARERALPPLRLALERFEKDGE